MPPPRNHPPADGSSPAQQVQSSSHATCLAELRTALLKAEVSWESLIKTTELRCLEAAEGQRAAESEVESLKEALKAKDDVIEQLEEKLRAKRREILDLEKDMQRRREVARSQRKELAQLRHELALKDPLQALEIAVKDFPEPLAAAVEVAAEETGSSAPPHPEEAKQEEGERHRQETEEKPDWKEDREEEEEPKEDETKEHKQEQQVRRVALERSGSWSRRRGSSPMRRGRSPSASSASIRRRRGRRSDSRSRSRRGNKVWRGISGGGVGKGEAPPLCIRFLQGKCDRSGCSDRHLGGDDKRAAYETLRNKICRYGSECRRADCIFRHPAR